MSDDSSAQGDSVLLTAFGVQRAHFPLVVVGHAGPIDVVEVFVLEGEEIVIPINGPPDAIMHGLVAVRVEVEKTKVEHARGSILNSPQKCLVDERCAIPSPPHAIGVKRVLYPEVRIPC